MKIILLLLVLALSGCASRLNHDDYVDYWNAHPLVKN